MAAQFWSLFADRDLVDPSVADVVVDEFQRIYRSAGRPAAPSSPPPATSTSTSRSGADGFYPRLAELQPPALFVWGSHDQLIPARFCRHVARWLPGAEQIVLDGCGHVPQVERPEQTTGLLERFFAPTATPWAPPSAGSAAA